MENNNVNMSEKTSQKNSITKLNSFILGITTSEEVSCLILNLIMDMRTSLDVTHYGSKDNIPLFLATDLDF